MCESCNKYKELESKYIKLLDTQKHYYEENQKKKKEYYEAKKEDIIKKVKEYQESHKEDIKKKRAENVVCECGGRYTVSNKHIHIKTRKHMNYINNMSSNID